MRRALRVVGASAPARISGGAALRRGFAAPPRADPP